MRRAKVSRTRLEATARPDHHVEPGDTSAVGRCVQCGRPYRAAPTTERGDTVQRYGSALCRYEARITRASIRARLLPTSDLDRTSTAVDPA